MTETRQSYCLGIRQVVNPKEILTRSHLPRLGHFIRRVVEDLQHVLQSLECKNWPNQKLIDDRIDGGQVGVHTSRAPDGQEDAKQGRIHDVLLHRRAYQSMQCVEDTDLSSTTMHPAGVNRGISLRKTVKKSCVGIVLGQASCHYQHCRRWCRPLPSSAVNVGRCRRRRRMRRRLPLS